jgi:hypothetical protein
MNVSARLLLFAGIGAMISGCSGSEADPSRFAVRDSAGIQIVSNFVAGGWSEEEAPQLVEELRIGTIDGEESYQFGRIASLDVDMDGNIYVLDYQAREVKAFDANGQFIRRMGRPGSGPGELGMSAFLLVLGDSVAVMDTGNRRLQWFGPDGVQAGNSPLPLGSLGLRSLPGTDQLIVQYRNLSSSSIEAALLPCDNLVLYSRLGEVLDTILTLPPNESVRIENGTKIFPIVGGATPVWGVTQGHILIARSTEMRIEMRSPEGSLSRIFTLDAPPVPIGDERRERLVSTMENAMGALRNLPGFSVGEVEINPYLPMISYLFEGPRGTIWVASQKADEAGNPSGINWYFFDSEGRFLGTLDLGDFQPMRALEDRVYGVEADDLGVQYVVRMKIDGL